MALIVTVAGATSESYTSVAEADAFNANRINWGATSEAARWAAATTDAKEDALRQATSDIDSRARVGEAYSDLQSLRFPRLIDVLLGVPFLLPRVKEATYWQAAYLLVNQSLIEQAASRRARAMFSFSEPDVSGTVAVDPSFGLFSPKALELLDSVVAGASGFLGTIPVRSHGQTRIGIIDTDDEPLVT